ncbi:hypothetical protein F53441_14561, partial [Fusarium austroafricanum]
GRRRRPILGAAVVVGASRAAARHEVREQELMATEREAEIQRGIELRRREEEEEERRTQRAVDEAMKKAALEERAAQQSAAAVSTLPPPQYYDTYPSMQVQTRDMGLYNSVNDAGPIIQSIPAYQPGPQSASGRLQSAQGSSPAPGSKIEYCTKCGFACQATDRFCRQCGARQAPQELLVFASKPSTCLASTIIETRVDTSSKGGAAIIIMMTMIHIIIIIITTDDWMTTQ